MLEWVKAIYKQLLLVHKADFLNLFWLLIKCNWSFSLETVDQQQNKLTCSDDIRRRPLGLFFLSKKIEIKAFSYSLLTDQLTLLCTKSMLL